LRQVEVSGLKKGPNMEGKRYTTEDNIRILQEADRGGV